MTQKMDNKRQDYVEQVDWLDTDASEDEDYVPQFPYQPPFPVALSIKDYFLKQPYTISGSSISDSDSSSSFGDDEEFAEDENHDNRTSTLAEDDFHDASIFLEGKQWPVTTSTYPSLETQHRGRAKSSSSSKRARRRSSSDNPIQSRTARINSSSWDVKTREFYRRKLGVSNETPADKVRRVIDATVDNGVEQVDMSNIGLTEIPNEVKELEYVTIVHNDTVKPASLQIYLYNNNLSSLNPTLFELKNLTVLSLRNNNLQYLSPDIALLENLVELSLGNNQLKYIPSELLHLKKLAILSLSPNPFLSMPHTTDQEPLSPINTRRWRVKQTVASLFETCTRMLFNNPDTSSSLLSTSSMYTRIIPNNILQRIRSVSTATNHACEHCHTLFLIPDIEEILWHPRILGNHSIPVLYRFCSLNCYQAYPFPAILTNDATAESSQA